MHNRLYKTCTFPTFPNNKYTTQRFSPFTLPPQFFSLFSSLSFSLLLSFFRFVSFYVILRPSRQYIRLTLISSRKKAAKLSNIPRYTVERDETGHALREISRPGGNHNPKIITDSFFSSLPPPSPHLVVHQGENQDRGAGRDREFLG